MANSPFKDILYPPQNSVPSTYTGEGGNYAVNAGNYNQGSLQPASVAPIQTMQTLPIQQLNTTSNLTQGMFGLPGYMQSTYASPVADPNISSATIAAGQAAPGAVGGGGFGGFKFGNMSAAQQMQVAGGIGGIIQGLVGRKKRRAAQRKAKKEYEKQRSLYQALDTSNLAAGFGNAFQNMENTYEDLTVNQQQAQFMAQQNQQNQANTMQALRGAAGGSGIAGLAQIIANQSQLATQKASASIGLQEAQNQKLAAQGAAQNQMAERKGEYQAQAQRLAGAREARTLDYQKQEMELGFAMQEKAAADQAVQAANAALFGGIGSLATTALTGGFSPA